MRRMTEYLIHHEDLRVFSQEVIMKMGASEDDAFFVADNLVPVDHSIQIVLETR
ncbi:MAG: hypothetical protein ACFFCX_16115 [Candidatus Sifarchaeia archaeon]